MQQANNSTSVGHCSRWGMVCRVCLGTGAKDWVEVGVPGGEGGRKRLGIGKGLAGEGLGRKVDACKVEAVYRNLSRSTQKIACLL